MKPSEEGISLRQLDIFCRVAEKQSFSKAAQSVYLTQPTVSEHVASLEKLLGVQLLDRVGRKVKLTKAGEIYYKYAKKIIDLRGEAQQVLDSFLQGLDVSIEHRAVCWDAHAMRQTVDLQPPFGIGLVGKQLLVQPLREDLGPTAGHRG